MMSADVPYSEDEEESRRIANTDYYNEGSPSTLRHSNEYPHSLSVVTPSLGYTVIDATETDNGIEKFKNILRNASLDNLSSIRDEEPPLDIKDVYAELQLIHSKLKKESQVLFDREQALLGREKRVVGLEGKIDKFIEDEVNRRWSSYEEGRKGEIEKYEEMIKTKIRDNKRLKENFDTIKTANDLLKKQLEDVSEQHERIERQALSVQSRLKNLQRKSERSERKVCSELQVDVDQQRRMQVAQKTENKPRGIKVTQSTYELLAILLEWVSDQHLRKVIQDSQQDVKDFPVSTEIVQDKCIKILPSLVDIIREIPGTNNKLQVPCLQFAYWALLHIDQAQDQRIMLNSTLRRLGEELYRHRPSRNNENETLSSPESSRLSPPSKSVPKEAVFFRSSNLHIRFLSSLIILKCMTQADHLAHVFDVLRNDLISDEGKEYYIYYKASPVISPHFRTLNKTFMNCAIDIFLQMGMESRFLAPFLNSLSCDAWFRACAMVLKSTYVDDKILEKLSVILQKLSKIKSNRKYFTIYSITTSIQDIIHNYSGEQAFLTLNMKSTLFNLGVKVAMIDN